LSTSELVPNLEHNLCWKPSGNLITATQWQSHCYNVIFYERNGLRRGEFNLPTDIQVVDMMWNIESNVLAIVAVNSKKGHLFQLWTMSNYHYYLKYQITLGSKFQIVWDNEKPLQFYLMVDNNVQTYTFSMVHQYSTSLNPENAGILAVIDHGTFI
jgi:elongator complex protein 1